MTVRRRSSPPSATSPVVLYRDDQVAAMLSVSRRTLREWRADRRAGIPSGPVFVQVEHRIRYRSDDIDAYVTTNSV